MSGAAKHPIWPIFHKVWGQAKSGDEYDKDELKRLEAEILRLIRGESK